jgi:hypothetical protein
MTSPAKLALAIAATLALSACAALPGADPHAAHRAASAASNAPSKGAPQAHEEHMAKMHEMHQKMHAAKSPEERTTLMAEHKKAMQTGMAMMEHGKPKEGMGMHQGDMHKMMMQRMERMEMMMRMMMQRDTAAPSTR